MTTPKTTLRRVGRELGGGFQLCSGVIVMHPVTHIMRGFLLDATGRAGQFFLTRVVLPFYHKTTHLILNYSDRLSFNNPSAPRGLDWNFPIGALDVNAAQDLICDVIRQKGELEYLEQVSTPAGFLVYQEGTRVTQCDDIGRVMDYATSLLLCGRVEEATFQYKRLLHFKDPYGHNAERLANTQEILADLTTSTELALRRVQEWEEFSRAHLLNKCVPV